MPAHWDRNRIANGLRQVGEQAAYAAGEIPNMERFTQNPQPRAGSLPPAPRVSAIIPARNEEANLASCIESLLQQGSEVEVLIADDNSQDGTAQIARRIAEQNPQVRLVSVPPLPAGWLGKNHALHVAVEHSQGEWLLFTDADTRHAPGKLPEVVQRAEREQLDLLSFSPRQETRTWWEQAVIPHVYRMLAQLYPYDQVNDPSDPLAAANGQYILIRRETYQALGGHQAIRSEVLEDVELARRAKHAGWRMRFDSGHGIVSTRMYRRFPELWEGWTKNLFLLYHRDRGLIRRAAARLVFGYFLPAAAGLTLVASGGIGAGIGAALFLYVLWAHLAYARALPQGERLASTLLLLPGAALLFLLLLNSERRYRTGKGIEWKGRHYRAPL